MNVDAAFRPHQQDLTSSHRGGESRRLGEIEVLRAVAILMVLAAHFAFNLLFWPTWITNFLFTGVGLWTGVDLFFAISGFVIARSLLPMLEGVTGVMEFFDLAVQFWIRRAWRLWPSAWLWLALPLPLCLVFNKAQAYGTLSDNWAMFVAGILNLANFHEALSFMQPHHGQATAFVQWSLALEEQFYLLLPVAAFLCRRYLPIPLLLIFAFAFISPDTPLAMMLRSGAVALGVLLAIWSRHPSYQQCRPEFLGRFRVARIAALTLGVAFLLSLGSSQLLIVPFFLGPVALISAMLVWIASYDRGYLWRPGRSRRVMEVIASRSYSLYLVHIPVYFGMHEMWFRLYSMQNPSRPQALIYLAIMLVPLIALTELNHRLIEKPLRERGRILASRFAAGQQEQAA
jgi:peptidoglycan/LPS O-acetylase OafA/YrhL